MNFRRDRGPGIKFTEDDKLSSTDVSIAVVIAIIVTVLVFLFIIIPVMFWNSEMRF